MINPQLIPTLLPLIKAYVSKVDDVIRLEFLFFLDFLNSLLFGKSIQFFILFLMAAKLMPR